MGFPSLTDQEVVDRAVENTISKDDFSRLNDKEKQIVQCISIIKHDYRYVWLMSNGELSLGKFMQQIIGYCKASRVGAGFFIASSVINLYAKAYSLNGISHSDPKKDHLDNIEMASNWILDFMIPDRMNGDDIYNTWHSDEDDINDGNY